MDKNEAALHDFDNKFNCAQSVFAAFADDLGLERSIALKTAAGFGGGMRCGEVCGAVAGALMAVGMKYGSSTPNDADGKMRANQKSAELINRFKEKNGTCICKELLGYNPANPEDMKKIQELGLLDTVCKQMISDAVGMLENIFSEQSC